MRPQPFDAAPIHPFRFFDAKQAQRADRPFQDTPMLEAGKGAASSCLAV